ncbi:MAG: GHMP kinase [Bryobacterales bacterium]|nr:GHMP kinase [Bryobacterales bacterium]
MVDTASLALEAQSLARLAGAMGGRTPSRLHCGLVVTRTPLRVSFAGGGTDFPGFYEQGEGAVLSTAIDKYVYVTLKRHDALFGAPIRLNYSETEQVETVDEIRNDIARACFRFLAMEPPIYMSTVADIPASSGLGSSSAYCVGLLHALHVWRGETVAASQLAEEAAHIEIESLRRPIGKQDQYAAAFGGFNLYRFLPGGGVSVEAQRFAPGVRRQLFDHLLLFWTGIGRQAPDVLAEQRANIDAHREELSSLKRQAWEMQEALAGNFHPETFGRALDEGWRRKRRLASTISNRRIDGWYERALSAGAWGGKLCGAGGGGFFLFAAPPERHPAVRAALGELKELSIRGEPQGSRVLMPHVE